MAVTKTEQLKNAMGTTKLHYMISESNL
jgi:hypothetical protein